LIQSWPQSTGIAAQKLLGEKAGIWSTLEGAATIAALPYLTKTGLIAPTDRVVLFNTAMGIKA
jgi:threonine synthase